MVKIVGKLVAESLRLVSIKNSSEFVARSADGDGKV